MNSYKAYINNINTYNQVIQQPVHKDTPFFFRNKAKRLQYFDNDTAILYGYKFHFVGRFTRKQKSANFWYLRGSMAYSSAVAKVDYAFYTIIMRYSVCTVKV